jgi:hypothetical protein
VDSFRPMCSIASCSRYCGTTQSEVRSMAWTLPTEAASCPDSGA